MSKVKVKRIVKSTVANKDVLGMFTSTVGGADNDGTANLHVVYPKYLSIRRHAERFIALLEAFRDSETMRAHFPDEALRLGAYVGRLAASFAETFTSPDLYRAADAAAPAGERGAGVAADPFGDLTGEERARFAAAFAKAKDCYVANAAILACSNLAPHKKSLEDAAALRGLFLKKGSNSLSPLPDLALNFRQLYIDDRIGDGGRELVLTVLHKLYRIGHDEYEAMSAPDVDMDEFVEVVMSSMGEVRKHVPRCDDAFRKIEESVELLRGNFGEYHRDVVASGNPTVMMENYILDVSKSGSNSPTVAAQFRRIIGHYREQAKLHSITDPRLRSVFSEVDKRFEDLEARKREADKAPQDDDGSDSDDEATPPAPTNATEGAIQIVPTAEAAISNASPAQVAKAEARRAESADRSSERSSDHPSDRPSVAESATRSGGSSLFEVLRREGARGE